MNVWCVSVKVNGHYPRPALWANRLHAAMGRNLRPFRDDVIRHVCFTDDPAGLAPNIETVNLARWWADWRDYSQSLYSPPGGWWAKTKIFQPGLFGKFGDVALYCDLDVLITGNLTPFLEPAAVNAFGILADGALNPVAKPGVRRKYNSSVMGWRVGEYSHAEPLDLAHAMRTYRSDQDYLAVTLPRAVTFDPKYAQRLSACLDTGPAPDTRVVLCIKPKQDVAAQTHKWVKDTWK